MRVIGTALATVALAVGLAACSSSNTVSKSEFKAELDKAGLGSSVDTQCLVDKLSDAGFKFKKWGNLSEDDNKKITDATTACISIKLPG